jgi:hypothetical protein
MHISYYSKFGSDRGQWLTPVILVSQEVEIRRITVQREL